MEHLSAKDPVFATPDALFARLQTLEIPYDLHHHAPVFTVAESEHLDAEIPGVHCRNLFLCDKKKTMFLVVVRNETAIDLKKLEGLIGSKRLSFGSEQRLWTYLGVKPGSVCPYAVINDTEQAVHVILDQAMMAAPLINHHPLLNSMTIGVHPDGLLKFIRSCGHAPDILDLSPAAPEDL